jgi:hypothetical protein
MDDKSFLPDTPDLGYWFPRSRYQLSSWEGLHRSQAEVSVGAYRLVFEMHTTHGAPILSVVGLLDFDELHSVTWVSGDRNVSLTGRALQMIAIYDKQQTQEVDRLPYPILDLHHCRVQIELLVRN